MANEEIYVAKKSTKIWNVDVDNIVISKLIKTSNIFKCFIGYIDDVVRPLVLILTKTGLWNANVYSFKDKGSNRYKENNKINKLIPFCIDGDKVLKSIKPSGLKFKTCKMLN